MARKRKAHFSKSIVYPAGSVVTLTVQINPIEADRVERESVGAFIDLFRQESDKAASAPPAGPALPPEIPGLFDGCGEVAENSVPAK